MDFAKNILKKYGWEEGQGLGKNNNGIVKPVKPNYKFDNAGLGLDKSAEFNNHWWERVFNEAASNIDVNKDKDAVSIHTKSSDGVEISTKEYSMKKMENMIGKQKHQNFLRSSILTGNGNQDVTDKIDTDNLKFTEYRSLTDEELFAACGGRTAHKGARHGIKMSGKLARIEKQELEWQAATNKKKNKRKHNLITKSEAFNNNDDIDANEKLIDSLYSHEYYSKSQKKKKKQHQIEKDLALSMHLAKISENKKQTTFDNETSQNGEKKKKHKKTQAQGNIFKELCSKNEVETVEDNNLDSSIVSTKVNHRSDKVYKKKDSKKDNNLDKKIGIDLKSKTILKRKEKKELKKSIKKINAQLETVLSLT